MLSLKMWLNGFHILVLIMLCGLVTSTSVGFILVEAMNLQSFQTMGQWRILFVNYYVHQGDNNS